MANGESPTPTSGILHSWKEIAAYFGVTIRTVQNWEEEKGLPVQRMPGPRGRVWARVEELEAWRGRRTDIGSDPSAPAVAPVVPTRNFPRWILWAAAGAVLLAIAGFTVRFLQTRSRERMISKVRVEGHTLVALDKRGSTRWVHTFDHPVKDLAGLKSDWGNLAPVVHDFDGDGEPDVAFPACHDSAQETDEIYYFDSDGSLRWKYRPDYVLRNARKESYAGKWKLRDMQIVPRKGGASDLVLAISHGEMFPGMVVRVGPDGIAQQTYYHSGHLIKLLVPPGGLTGSPVIYAAGIANSYRSVTVLALDPDRMNGASAEPPSDTEHTFIGLPRAAELARVLVPPTRLSLVDSPSNSAGGLYLEAGKIVVEVFEHVLTERGLVSVQPGYYLVFDPHLRADHYRPNDGLEVAYRRYHASGLLPSPDPRPELDRVIQGIRTLVAWH